jgi:hypothetical protein
VGARLGLSVWRRRIALVVVRGGGGDSATGMPSNKSLGREKISTLPPHLFFREIECLVL